MEVNADGYLEDTRLGSDGGYLLCSRHHPQFYRRAEGYYAELAEDAMARARFLREARAAAQIQHPNVAESFTTGSRTVKCFYAMELVMGNPGRACATRWANTSKPRAEVVEQTARAWRQVKHAVLSIAT